MNSIRRKCFGILACIVLPLFILGCSPKKSNDAKITEEIKLNSGAVLKSEEGNYRLYDYENGEYTLKDSSNTILAYDKSTSSYISVEDGKNYVIHNGNKFEITDDEYIGLKLSPDASYISYFIENNGLKLKIFKTDDNKEININSNVSISGTLYDWYDKDTLVYYGVSNDGVNGLFIYNINDNKEDLLYKINEGYLAFLKGTVDNILFLQLTLENNKELMMIDKNTKEVKMLSNKIEELSDIIVHNNKVYFTGKISGDINSLYQLSDNKAKRLIFDFPTTVRIDKGLKIDENGDILFIGSNEENLNEQQVYKYSEDGTTSVVSKNAIDYVFLDYRS